MDSPINRMIDRASNRKVASSIKAKAKRTTALNDQVLSLVVEANATALPERQVTPRAALIVMSRAMKELSSLSDESRAHGVLREVSKFISLNQKTLLASATFKHVDLLPKGHPLSPLNASLTDDDLRKKYSEWIAADPAIADEARPLVAMAHSLPPESIEREHAFLRLRTLQASAVPAYFKIDDVTALVAAFSSGNSSAARRARVALQWRDRMGRWIEMGRGINFRFRLPDGSIATGRGNYVGAGSNPRVERTSKGTSLVSDTGLIEVSGVPGLQPGLYAIGSDNAAAYQARIPGFEAPQAPSFEDQFDADIPNVSDLQAVRRELPIGWKKQGPYYVSDDNYAVVPGPNGQPQMVTRLNADGRPGGSVGNARDWSEVNALIEKDQPSFDKEIARIQGEEEEGQLPLARIPGATEEDVVSFDDIANMQKQRAEENKKFDESRPAAKPLGDKDLNGNVVPKAWVRDAKDDTKYTRQMPLRDGGTYPLIARVNEDGTYIAGHAGGWIPEPGTDGRGASRKFESWDEIKTEGIPDFVDYLNETFTKDNPIDLSQDTTKTPDLSPNFLRTLFQAIRENDLSGQRFPRSMLTKKEREFFDSLDFNKDGSPTNIQDKENIVKDMMDKLGVEPMSYEEASGSRTSKKSDEPTIMVRSFPKDLLRKIDLAVKAINDNEDAEATSEADAIGTSQVRDNIGFARGALQEGRVADALRYLSEAQAVAASEESPSEGRFPGGDKAQEAAKILQEVITALENQGTKNILGFDVPEDAKLVASEQNGDAIVVQMPDGSLVQYDTGGTKGIKYTQEQKDKFINDIKADETIWFDEEGKTNWKALLEGDTGFNYDSAKATALDSSRSAQERYAAIFDGAKGTNLPRYVEKFGTKRSELDPSIPNGAMVVFADGDGQNLTLRYPDGSYHSLDTGAKDKNGLISASPVSAYDAGGVNDKVLKDLLDPESLMYARGGFIDDTRQAAIAAGSSGSAPVDFTNRFKELKDLTSGDYSMNQLFDTMFKDAKYETRDERPVYTSSDYEVPEDAKIYYSDQEAILAKNANGEWGMYFSDGESVEGDDIEFQDYLDSILINDGDSPLAFYQGGFVDEDLQGELEEARSKEPVDGSAGDGGPDAPQGMKLDFADPEQAARDAGLPADASFNDIAKAWFDQNIKPVAPTAKLDGFEEGGPDGPSVSITADNDEDLLNAFRVYFGDDEATLEDLRDNSEEYNKKDLVEIDKATLDALDKRMREDSTGEYSMEGVTFSSNNNGDIIMYPDGWEPGDKIIGRVEDDGGIDWESDAQYDKYADKVREALRGMGGGDSDQVNSKEIYERRMAGESLQEVADSLGLTREEVRRIESEYARNNPAPTSDDIDKPFVFDQEDYDPATFTFRKKEKINDSNFYSWDVSVALPGGETNDYIYGIRVDDDGTVEYTTSDGMYGDASGIPGEIFPIEVVEYMENYIKNKYPDDTLPPRSEDDGAPGASAIEGKKYTVDFAMDQEDYGDIGLDPDKDYTPEEIANAWIKTKGLEGKVTFAGAVESNGMWPEMSFNIPDEHKDAFAEAYGYDSWKDLNEDAQLDEDDEGPDEPPSPGGGTPPKVPSPSTPGSPALFGDFDKPAGAYQLRTTEYEPEGRIDEASTDFTDDPRRLATKFSLDDLVTAFTEALIGRPDEAAMQDILNANVDENDDLPDLADLADVAESNAPRATANNASGAGALEFNAGEEYVLAESLYNAVYEAGGDPNRVIANAYDAVNGNRNNAQKILEAQGGVSSPEEVQLVEDITDEIRQIKDATPEGDVSVSQKRSKPDKKFKGELIENVPVDFNNPDYFDMDTDAYIPSVPEIDENGYTDNPEILTLDYESADLIEQMIEGITDGSGVALLDFGGEQGVGEVPVEALRDALQLDGINTNDILFKLRDESNDMSDDPGDLEDMIDNLEDPESPAKPSGMPEQISNQKIKDKNGGEFELNLIKIGDIYEGALINKDNDRIQIVVRDRDEKVAKKALKEAGAYIKQAANGDESMDDGMIPNLDSVVQTPETPALQSHSQMIKDLIEQTGVTIADEKADQIRDAIDAENMLDWSEADDAEIIEAITEVAGTSIFGQVPTPAAERVLPPTTGQRQAPVDSADKPRDPSVDAPSARPARESSEGFSPFSDVASELDDTVDDMVVELLDRSANTIVQWFMGRVSGVSLLAFNSRNGEIAVRTPESKSFVVKSNGIVTDLTMDPSTADSFFSETGSAFGWEPVPQEVMDAIVAESIRRYPDVVQEPAPAAPEGAPEAPAAPAAPVPVFTYPGPYENGYTANNTTLASDGSVIGAGSIVTANRDGKRGVVLSIQNGPEYARIRFEDGKIAVRSANQIKAVSNPDGTLAMLPSGAAAPSGVTPSTDVESRLDAPIRPAPNVARSGSAWGINDTTDVPDFIKPLAKQDVSQSDFSAWGERDAEIAKAASTRATVDSLLASVDKYEAARERGEEASVLRALKDETNKILLDIYGGRDGVSFGADAYKVNITVTNSSLNVRTPANGRPTKSYTFNVSFYLTGSNGQRAGGGSRSINIEDTTDENGNLVRKSSAKNDILEIIGANKKKGFASGYNRYMENWYIANGIDKVKVFAAGGGKWQGAFVWALNGFDWENADAARGMIRSLNIAAKTPEEKDIAKKLADKVDAAGGDVTKVPTPLEVALAGWYPGAKKWFGKDVIIARTWSGVKHLQPTAREQLQAVNYNQIKNAERRIQAGQNKPGTSAVGLAQVMDNSFQTNNPELGAYIDQIRDALKNNRSLAFLSPAAKSALGQFVSKELLNKNSNMPMEDLFRLQTALSSEYRAENDYSNPFGAIEDALAGFTMTDFYRNSDELKAAGFSAKSLTGDDSGVNDTFMVTHKPSGQVFFVKEEKLSRSYYGTRGLTSEVEANTIMNALEMMGVPSVRGSRTDKDIIIMSQAGATLPLAAPAENASTMINYGITDANGDIFASDSGANFVDLLRNPADVFNMAIVDMLGAGQDRHDANWMAAFDKTDNRLFMFPIDNSLLTVDKNESGIEDFFISVWPDAGDVYEQAVSRIIRSAGEERAAEMFMNQVRKLITNLDNPLFQPKGEELAALIDKWGTYDAFKDELKKRLTTIVTPGSAENKALINSMKMSYWR